MNETHVTWAAPAPLWAGLPEADPSAAMAAFARPELLRFASDSFMEEFIHVLTHDPARLAELRAQAETWRVPSRTIAALPDNPPYARTVARQRRLTDQRVARTLAPRTPIQTVARALPLKLYQPAHNRFYLVSSCLVCRMPGLPDRALDLSAQERVSFVVRLLRPRSSDGDTPTLDISDCDEYALVGTGDAVNWKLTSSSERKLEQGEEQLPLFGVNFQADDGRRRRIFAGLMPAGKREVYMGARERAAAAAANPSAPPSDPRAALLLSQVIEPWKQIIYRMEMRGKQIREVPPPGMGSADINARKQPYREAREQAQTIAWYILLDLADFLETYANDVWQEVIGTGSSNALTRILDEIQVPDALRNALITPDDDGTPHTADSIWGSLREALAGIGSWRDSLEQVTAAYTRINTPKGWPTMFFPLADPEHPGPLWGPSATNSPSEIDPGSAGQVEDLMDQIMAALPSLEAFDGVAPPLPLVAQQALSPAGPAWFTIRCVFERPNCGPLSPALLSAASEPFQIAAFFDPDAPARPIRIALPMDISPGGLRKFAKNTGFVMSDMLHCQVAKLGGLSLGDLVRSVLPWPLHKDLPASQGTCANGTISFGMICSISIPIITICALILLMIIVSLLDIIFKWIPFFILCLPLPGLKARPKPPS